MIKNLKDLHKLFFTDWCLKFSELKDVNLISESNSQLLYYAKNFGSSIPKNNNQDHFEVTLNKVHNELTNFISENSGNWTIAINKITNDIYTNEQWLYTDTSFYEYKRLGFGLEECLISFSLQEIYFAFCEKEKKVNSKLNLEPIWINKRYKSMDKTHSFYYDSEFKALQFIHSENNFEDIAFIG
ncbi:hypothetical protein [Winogradskyella poriferorum]|uniref:hypothetical protein n=1 Tax=Winogradskyella poriferorum TaxID=307627 RepID=UPI003D660705